MELTVTPPGPRNRFLIGFIPEMRKNPLEFLMKLSMEYPKIAYFKIANKPAYFINHPDYLKHVLLENHRNYWKTWGYDKFYPIFGKGLLTSNGEFWIRQRKLAQPAFHRQRLESFAGAMINRTEQMIGDWKRFESGEPFELGAEIRGVTMDIVTQTMFGMTSSKDTDLVGWALEIVLAETYDRVFSLFGALTNHLPTIKNIRFNKALTALNRIVYAIIAERRKMDRDTGDLLSMYIQTRDENSGDKMTDSQLRDEVMTIFLAGHETSAHSIAWACYLLAKNKTVLRKAQEEIDRVLGSSRITMAALPELKYLNMVIEETMRLYPVSWIMSRVAVAPDYIGDYPIPENALLVMSQYVMHRNPEIWAEPEVFEPLRFAPENAEKRSKFAYFPFGQGPRQCIGMNFAMMEMKILLAMMMQKYELDLVPGHPVVPEPVMTLRPKYGVKMTLRKRT